MAGTPAETGSGRLRQPGRPPLWPVIMTVLLLALGFRRRRDESLRRSLELTEDDPEARGRWASEPSHIPVRGWKDILLRVYENISEHRVIAIAAGVTFYTILAIFPAIAALVALYGLFADPKTISGHLDSLAGLVPEGAIQVIKDEMTRVAAQSGNALGLTFVAGLAISLWSANAGVKSLFDGMNLVYD